MKYLSIVILVLLFLNISFYSSGQYCYKSFNHQIDSSVISQKIISLDSSCSNSELNKILTCVALSFIDTPYKSGTLETNTSESLIINASELDCLTLVENSIAITKTISSGNLSFENFKNQLKKLRYRNGIINGYASRIHYFSEWLSENEKNNIFEICSKKIGGIPYDVTVNFMSSHPQFYKQLKDDSLLTGEISLLEQRISTSDSLFYIPKDKVKEIEKYLKEGMIIGITTNIPGLDISHSGITVKVNDRIHLLHASSDAGKVVITPIPLYDYLMSNKKQTGIIVAELR